MSQIDQLLERNRKFAKTGAYEGVSPLPRHGAIVVTCLDARVEPALLLGLELGDAGVLRNAGGRVTREVIEEIAFIGSVMVSMFGAEAAPPFEVTVIHHTDCGSAILADPTFRKSYAELIGADEATLAGQAVTDPDATVRDDVELFRQSPLLPSMVTVSGHVYDTKTGLIRTVAAAEN